MKYSYAALALAVAVAHAQVPTVPTCSQQCLLTALTTDGCESLTDFACHCSQPQLASQITPCVVSACSPEEAAEVASIIASTCASVGVPLSGAAGSTPTEESAATEEPTEAPAPQTTLPATEETTSDAAAPTDYSATVVPPPVTHASTTSTVTAVTHSSTTLVGTGHAQPTGAPPTNNGTTTPGPSPPPFTGAANHLAGASSMSAVFALVVAAFYML